jgi:FecR protein
MTEPDDRDRLGPPPVEPMSDMSWARVERGLWARMDGTATTTDVSRRPRVWPWIVTPVIAAAAVAAIVLAFGHGPAPSVATTTGDEPTRVVTDDAPSSVSLGDAHVTLDAHSAVVVSQSTTSPTAVLERGAAWFSVAPRGERPPFIVIAGDTRVRVVGTRFRVARAGERSEVTVDHGLVEVQFRGTVARVGAHQTWSSMEPATVRDTTIAEVVEPGDITIDPAAPAAPVREPKHHAAAPANLAPGAPAPPSDPDATRYEALTKLEASYPDVAMKGYLELSQGSGRWAEVALFAAARLAVDRHDARARTLLEIYLRRFPAGANATDARNLLTRTQGAFP